MTNALYQVVSKQDSGKIAEFFSRDGQFFLPLVDLIVQGEMAIDEMIDQVGRKAIEALLAMSAQQVAGPKQSGKFRPEGIGWHGSQSGTVCLSNRKVRVTKPRLRRKGNGQEPGEVAIPAYEALQASSRLGSRMVELLLAGLSGRKYKQILPDMAAAVGVSKSQVSRQFIEASEKDFQRFCQRRFEDKDIRIVYLDGIRFGPVQVIVAIGVDSQGFKHVLGIREGSSENGRVATDLLTDLVERGVKPDRMRLFVVDGSKALRYAIDAVYGSANPVQRCRLHKERNILGYLPKDQQSQVRSILKTAWTLEASAGKKKLQQLARWLENEYPSASVSVLEGLDELFTINRLGLPASLRRCLGTTNVIESPNSGLRSRTGRVKRWRDGHMVIRWVGCALLDMEKRFKKIMGHPQLSILTAKLDELESGQKRKIG
jgi:putative transposase